MPAKQPPTNYPYDPDTYGDGAFDPTDDAPDLSTPYWVEQFAKATVQRGRPKASTRKVPTTLRLDPDVLESFRASGPGWQSRINAALRKAAGLG
jgi:uncharacterized protein (DUF4415 family)